MRLLELSLLLIQELLSQSFNQLKSHFLAFLQSQGVLFQHDRGSFQGTEQLMPLVRLATSENPYLNLQTAKIAVRPTAFLELWTN